ncbi:eukaryotic translation initiation factor 4 gamma 1-like isoform X2 [Salminus brasiliensis]|uniref:eukaryotic translation initiation factor 4 gamma 1-like isoform X2 n=1 Tax=Salminus brasiliensis TaxID=930266 RepID=UPI003B8364F4
MNKAPQSLTGPPSTSPHPSGPLPAPSPGLSQPNFPPTQPPSVVFATPPPQMNPSAQPRQFSPGARALHQQGGFRSLQQYYTARPTLPANSARVQQSSAPRPIPPPHGTHPPHVFQTGSQMMMIPQQPISFPNQQGPAYYIHGQSLSQYRPSYVAPQQYQVAGSPGFYPGTSPAEYAGAYYPAQPQFTPPVAAAPVIMNPAPQQQQAPPPQQQAPPTKRERKQIRIRDPNRGGRDITEEIMSGGRSASTPTPPQVALSGLEAGAATQSNGEGAIAAAMTTRTDERVKPVVSLEFPIPPGESPVPDSPPTPPPTSPISDTVDAPPPAPADESHVTPGAVEKATFPMQPKDVKLASNGSASKEKGAGHLLAPAPQVEPAAESPIAQPEELQLFNGVAAPEAQQLAPSEPAAERDVSPIAEPDVTKEAPLVTEKSSSRTIKAPPPVVKETATGVVKDTLATVVPETPSVATKECTIPAGKAVTAPVSKTVTAPVVKETPTSVVKEAPTSVVKEAPAPLIMTPVPVAKETPAPLKMAPAPVAKETLAPVAQEAPVPVAKETPAPLKMTPVPVAKETLAPIAREVPVPTAKETLAQVAKETPAPVAKEMPPPPPVVAKETPAPVVKETSIAMETPVVKETPLPVTTQTIEPLVKEPPAPVLKEPSPAAKETPKPVVKESPVPTETVSDASKTTPPSTEEREDTPPPQTAAPEITMQAISVPKKKRKMKDLNKKEAGDLLDAFKEPTPPQPEATPPAKPDREEPAPVAPPPVEEVDETWEEKEDKLDAENIQPQGSAPATPTEQKYQYKEEQWKPLNPEEKKKYDREFLLGFQFISASMHKPEGLPHISDVVLDKANKTPLRPLDPSRLPGMNCGPDFTPSFANLGRQPAGGRGPPPGMGGPRRSGQGPRKEPRKIIASVSLSDDVQLNKAEKAWKPTLKRASRAEEDEPEAIRTQELFRRVRSILNKLTPQMFQPLMKQVTELTIDTEERLKGVIDLIFEKAISEPNFSVAYANMCRCLMGLKVPTSDKPGGMVNFRKLLLNRCQKEFEKDKDDDEIFEKKQKELDAATVEEEKQRLKEELEDAKDKARRRSLGNIKFIGELFKLKMLTENIMHDCIVKLLKNHDEESLECLCRLLSTIGKDLDFEKAKPRMDQYFHQMEKIIKERKTSSRIRFMLQDVIDLRRNNWVPRRGDQGPKTLEQIHKEAELEEHREQIKVQQQLLSKKDGRGSGGGGGGGGSGGGGGMGRDPRGGPHASGPRDRQGPDEGWNTVPISTKNRTIDASRLSKITKPGALDFNNQLLAPGGKGTWGSWGKGSSGGSGAKPSDGAQDSGRTSTLNRFSALQQASSSSSSSNPDAERRVPQRSSSSRERGDRFERRDERGPDRLDRNRPAVTKRSFSREKDERGAERELRAAEAVRRVASMTDERDRERERERERERSSRDRAASKENVRREPATTPPPAPSKPALSPDELEKKSTAIIEEYLHINDLKEALQCVSELNCATLLCIFVRTGIESTLERSTIAREHMGLLLQQLVKAGTLSTQQYYKGLLEVLEVAEDMAIDIPHIWVYLAELIAPMLHEGGIPMGLLFREVSKPLVPIGKAGDLLAHILNLFCKGMSHKKAGTMWREAGLGWKDFLPEDQDVNKFVTEKGVEYTLGEECVKSGGGSGSSGGSGRKSLSPEEMSKQLDVLLQDKADNQLIYDWVEANLDEPQTSSNAFVRAVMTSVCQAAIICENPYKVDTKEISQRAKLLQRYIKDEQKELQALYALQSLMVQMEQPPNLLRMFFDVLYDEDVIKEEGFYKWESSKDAAEQQGKGVALKSVTAFFTWLREAEDESDNS